jgi:hypothetical protein
LLIGWLFQIGFVIVDYKYSLRGLAPGSADYRVKLSEVWILRWLTVCNFVYWSE